METQANDYFFLIIQHSWANMGLIHYSMEAHTPAITAFRNAIQLSAGTSGDGRTSLSGRLQNNLACVNAEMGSLELALSEFEQSLRWQKDSSSSNDADTSDADNLLSISLTIFNIGVTCARQKHYHAAFKHTEASHAMQEALLGPNNELTLNTLFYLDLIKKMIATSEGPETKMHTNVPQNHTLGSPQRITRTQTDEVLDILDFNPASPGRRVNSENDTATKHGLSFFSKSNEISYPMLSLGSLKVEATTVEQVRDCLDRYDTNLSKGKDRRNHVSIMRSLLCKKPIQGTKQPSISSKLMNFGMKTLRKREMQAELHENLERYGPRHPLVGQAHHSLALVLLCIENFEESISNFDKSIRINTHALGVKHPDVSVRLISDIFALLQIFPSSVSHNMNFHSSVVYHVHGFGSIRA
jgi:tetratricopeptide (TPR) repeat protein